MQPRTHDAAHLRRRSRIRLMVLRAKRVSRGICPGTSYANPGHAAIFDMAIALTDLYTGTVAKGRAEVSNPDYRYMCRIIAAIQSALRQE